MKNIYFLIILKAALCSTNDAKELTIGKAINSMSRELYQEIANRDVDKNIVISPWSIHTAMSMLMYGAEGYSMKQLKGVLRLDLVEERVHFRESKSLSMEYENLDKVNLTLNSANALFVADDMRLHDDYESKVEENFDANIQSINFAQKKAAVKTINQWAANKTNNLIKELVSQDTVDKYTRMIVTNAVYFNAKWATMFNPKSTSKKQFKVPRKGEVETDFMFMSSTLKSAFIKELNATMLALPYIIEDFEMIIFHPSKDNDVEKMENMMFNSNKTLLDFRRELKSRDTHLHLPKFEAGSEISLVQTFQALNVTEIFSDRADFGRMTDSRNIEVGDIKHKTKIRVFEEGSEAAAVTGAVLDTRSGAPTTKISINSPFLFFIQDTKKNIPIFMGKIVDPTMENKEKPDMESDITFDSEPKSTVCPGGDVVACTDECDVPDARSHRICTNSCAKKCPDS